MPHAVRPLRALAVASLLALTASLGPLAPAAHAKGTKAQCDAVDVIIGVNPDFEKGSKQTKSELAKLKAAEAKVPAKLKGDAKKVRAFWEAMVKWTGKYSDPVKAMANPKGLADYSKLLEKVTTDVAPAIQHIAGWSMLECV